MPVNTVLGHHHYTTKYLKYNLIDPYLAITTTMGCGEPEDVHGSTFRSVC